MRCAGLFVLLSLACLAADARAQREFIYDFQVVVTANEVIASGLGGTLSTLPVGTLGELRLVIDGDRATYPGWNTETIVAHDILEVSFTAGSLSANGLASTYPTASPFLALQIADNEVVNTINLIRVDALEAVLALSHPDIAFTTMAIRQDSQPGQVPTLLSSLFPPTSANLQLATTRKLVIDSAIDPQYSVTFTFYGMQGTQECPGDVNGDGALSPADFSAWIAAFNANLPACDQNSDGVCSPADFSSWIGNYNAGC